MKNILFWIKSYPTETWMSFLFIIVMPGISTLLLSIPFLLFVKYDNSIVTLFQTGITMGLSFIALTYYIAKQSICITPKNIGIKKLSCLDWFIISISLVILYIYLRKFRLNIPIKVLAIFSIQTLIVATSEEFWARGILYYYLSKFIKNSILIILLTAGLFTFIIHVNHPFFENLLFRFPGAIAMTIVYWKTKKLPYSILVHFIYNMVNINI